MFFYGMCYVLWLLDLISCSIITCFGFEQKNENTKRWKLILGLFLVQFPFVTIKFVYNWQPLLRSIGLFGTIGIALVFTLIFYKGHIWQKILFVMFRIICCCAAEWLMQFVFQDLLLQLEEINFYEPVVVCYIAFTEIVFLVLFLLFMLIWKKIVSKSGYEFKIFFIFIIFPISQIVMMEYMNLRILTEMTPASVAAIVSLLIGIVADILLLFLLLRQQTMHSMEIKLNEVEKTWQVEQNHYRDIEARREELAKIRHDMAEQFIVMGELVHQENYEKVKEMLSTLQEYVASTKEYVYCADPIVNAIMAENERECKKLGIDFKYNLEIMQPLKMNPVVICSIFSNLMRNAIAAAKEVDKEAFVLIKASINGDYLNVKVKNSFVQSKKKKTRKGYGLEILNTIADKYHGKMETSIENKVYSAYISVENIDLQD